MAPNNPYHPHARRRRALLAVGAIGLLLSVLGTAYFRTQIVHNQDYTLRSNDNRLRVIPIPAARGAVYDRTGKLIAETATTHTLFLEPASPDSTQEMLALLQPLLQLSDSDVAHLVARRRKQPREPLKVATDLSFDQLSFVEEHRGQLPAASLMPTPLRRYPAGAAAGHLTGYVGEISERELADSVRWKGYRAGQQIGKAGVEREYERVLGGTPGERYVEVDARGRVVRPLAPEETKPPVAGRDVHLTLDLPAQEYAHDLFPEGTRGAVVAIVPRTGEIRVLYSNPGYDPNELAGGISREVWRKLNGPDHPLVNRATTGIYPPGSTFKLATAVIGLANGVITPDTHMPIPCTGGMSYAGRYARCWKKEGHGSLDLAGAIANSCNVYFYQLGIWLGLNRLTHEGTRLGFSRRTGVDLPTERAGTFPTGTEWYRKHFGWTPTPSEVMSLAIGQGPNAQTPLRLAQFYAALAGNGTAPRPHLLQRAEPGAPETDLKVSPQILKAVRDGLARVTEPGGTAYMASLKRWKLYGKTGTAQNAQGADHGWFAGFAGPPDGEPEIAIAVVVEHSGHGGTLAAPIAAKVAGFYLDEMHDVETDRTHQTLAERMGIPFEGGSGEHD
ncbi:MAG TPA: penicillin-binding protein 2 [Longimicrobiaceae bacterium]|nr:penicillin-binding protein 2 [Longimicrobiaceae bacterium]